MKEKLQQLMNTIKTFWTNRTKGQKRISIGSIIILVMLITGITLFVKHTDMVPLYNNLSLEEVGQIKTELDSRNIPYDLTNGGKTIMVPDDKADTLLVDLASEGIPSSGNIDYSFFSKNASWGITDNEFDMIKLDAMQTELEGLITHIEGINDAKVMINIPKDPVFVSDQKQEASASVVIHTKPGQKFKGNQIDTLYKLISKAVPNLPADNIVIMNQYSQYYNQDMQGINGGEQGTYTYQQSVKQDIEHDVQQRVQQLLGAMVGPGNVIVSVTSDIDFTQENREEKLVKPVDVEDMKGLPVSIEKVHESYKGDQPPGGIAGTGDDDETASTYQEEDTDGNGDYKLKKETINNEYNRIRKEIVESPYKIRDLGIQVVVNRAKSKDGAETQYLSAQEEDDVKSGISDILNSVISTSIDRKYVDDNDQTDIDDNQMSIVFQAFADHQVASQPTKTNETPFWFYVLGAGLLIIIIILIIALLMRRKKDVLDIDDVNDVDESEVEEFDVPDPSEEVENEETVKRKQLEKMAQDKPEDFAKLLKNWIEED